MHAIKSPLTYIALLLCTFIITSCTEFSSTPSAPVTPRVKPESLTQTLTDSLNITQPQAQGGAGALLNIVGSTLSKTDFSTITNVIPDAGSILSAAPSTTTNTSSMASSLTNQFINLGMNSGMISSFATVITDYLKVAGGDTVSNLFSSGLSSTLSGAAGSLLKGFSQ